MRLQYVAMLIIFTLLFACGGNDSDQKEKLYMEDIKKEAKDALDTAKKFTQQEKDQYLKNMNSQLDSLKLDIANLKKDAQGASESTKQKMDQQIQTMESQVDSLEKKIENFGATTGKAWSDFVTGANKSLKDLQNAIDKAKERFK